MWLKSLRKVPLGPFTMTVRPFSETLTGNQRQTHVNRLRGQHHNAPFKRTGRRTLLGDVNGLVAENGLHSTRDNRKKLHTLEARPFSRDLSAPPPHVPWNAQLRSGDPMPPTLSATSEPAPPRRAPLPTPTPPAQAPEERREAAAAALNSTAGPSPGLEPPGERGDTGKAPSRGLPSRRA